MEGECVVSPSVRDNKDFLFQNKMIKRSFLLKQQSHPHIVPKSATVLVPGLSQTVYKVFDMKVNEQSTAPFSQSTNSVDIL